MSTPSWRTAGGGLSDSYRASARPTGAGAWPTETLGGTAVIWFAKSLGVAFSVGILIGIYQILWGTNVDATEIANFAYRSVGLALNIPVEWITQTFVLSGYSAEILRNTVHYLEIPYEASAYAGGYLVGMVL
ncbi:MAG: hypothetical protein P4L90_22175 [Rhodopila sp.]|nr:hypothetical protein [Rhodopila sp.]